MRPTFLGYSFLQLLGGLSLMFTAVHLIDAAGLGLFAVTLGCALLGGGLARLSGRRPGAWLRDLERQFHPAPLLVGLLLLAVNNTLTERLPPVPALLDTVLGVLILGPDLGEGFRRRVSVRKTNRRKTLGTQIHPL